MVKIMICDFVYMPLFFIVLALCHVWNNRASKGCVVPTTFNTGREGIFGEVPIETHPCLGANVSG